MPHGGKRPGAGRRKGTPNKATAPFRERLRAMFVAKGCDPFQYMLDVVADTALPHELRLRAANELGRYAEPQLKSTDMTVSGNPDAPLIVRVRRRGDK